MQTVIAFVISAHFKFEIQDSVILALILKNITDYVNTGNLSGTCSYIMTVTK